MNLYLDAANLDDIRKDVALSRRFDKVATPLTYAPVEYLSLALGVLLVAFGGRAWIPHVEILAHHARRGGAPPPREPRGCKAKWAMPSWWNFANGHIFYSYAVRGVEYTASQDLGFLRERPARRSPIDGPRLREVRRGAIPANSIVAAEEWSGLRK